MIHHKKPALAFRAPPDPDTFVYGDSAGVGNGVPTLLVVPEAVALPNTQSAECPSVQASELPSSQSPTPLSIQVPGTSPSDVPASAALSAGTKRKTVVRADGRELRRLGVYIPVDVHRALATRCAVDDIDVSDFVSAVLRERLAI